MEIVERVVTLLQAHQVREGEYRARCPVHQSRSINSISIKDAGDRVLIHCHKGCKFEDILAAMGMSSARELFISIHDSFNPHLRRQVQIARGKRVFDEWCSEYLTLVCRQLRELEKSIGSMAQMLALSSKYEWAELDTRRQEEIWELLSQCYRLRSDMESDFAILNGNDRDAKVPIYRRVIGVHQ